MSKKDNLRKIIEKQYKKIANQTSEINLLLQQKEELQNKLNVANRIVAKQLDGFNAMCKSYEGQLSVQDREMDRRLTIIHYLEEKCLKVYE